MRLPWLARQDATDTWLTEVEYQVNWNGNAILDVSYILSGVAAYPDSFDEHITLNLKTGKRLKVSELFIAAKLPQLVAMINRAYQQDKQKALQSRHLKTSDKETQEWVRHLMPSSRFEGDDLKEFSVSAKGVTFYVSFGFPHAIKAFEPDGRYFFSYAPLKPFVRRDGLLKPFLR